MQSKHNLQKNTISEFLGSFSKSQKIIFSVVILLAVAATIYFSSNLSKPAKPNPPEYIVQTVQKAELSSIIQYGFTQQEIDQVNNQFYSQNSSQNNNSNNSSKNSSSSSSSNPDQFLPSPDKTKQITLVANETNGRMILSQTNNQLIPITNILDAKWIDAQRVLVSYGKIQFPTVDIQNNNTKDNLPKVTGEKGVDIYNFETSQRTTIFTSSKDIDLFSTVIKDNHIFICTGQNIEKLDLEGKYISTLYKHNDTGQSIFLSDQKDTPTGKLKIQINKGNQVEDRLVSIG